MPHPGRMKYKPQVMGSTSWSMDVHGCPRMTTKAPAVPASRWAPDMNIPGTGHTSCRAEVCGINAQKHRCDPSSNWRPFPGWWKLKLTNPRNPANQTKPNQPINSANQSINQSTESSLRCAEVAHCRSTPFSRRTTLHPWVRLRAAPKEP